MVTSSQIARAKLGDAEALAQIVRAYHARCVRFARGMLRDQDEAEDAVQEAFVRMYRALPRYEERDRFDYWLFRILANCCRTANATLERRGEKQLFDEEWDRMERPGALDLVARLETSDAIRRAVAELPEHQREIFLLYHVEGFSYEEMERMTGIGRSALKMRVKRACDMLRERLEGIIHG